MKSEEGATCPLRLERPTILVVEPSNMLRRAYRAIMQRHGLDVHGCGSVLEALEQACREKPAGILTAMELPDLNGFSLVAALRSSSRHRAIPIAMITSSGEMREGMEHCAPDAILKKGEHLEGQIDGFLDRCWLSQRRDQAPSTLTGRQVLVAEDSRVNRVLVGRLLHVLGAEVELVADGLEALDAVQRKSFDLVLMDIEMPRMDGREAALRIAADKPELAIVALTGHEPDELAGAEAFTCVLHKPVSREDLMEVLSRALAA